MDTSKKRHLIDLERYFLTLDKLIEEKNAEIKVIVAKRKEAEKELKKAGGISLIINGTTGKAHAQSSKHSWLTLCGRAQHGWPHTIYRIGVEPTCKNCLRILKAVGRNSVPNDIRYFTEVKTTIIK